MPALQHAGPRQERAATERLLGGEVVLDGGAIRLEREVGEGQERLVLAREGEAAGKDGVEQALVADLVDGERHSPGPIADRESEGAPKRGQRPALEPLEQVGQGRVAGRAMPVGRDGRVGHLERPCSAWPK